MKPRILVAILSALVLSNLISSNALAHPETIFYDSGPKQGQSTGIILNVPHTYSSYVDAYTTDKITTTGVGARVLRGRVILEYILDNGRQPVPNGVYTVDQTGDLDLTITYPPVSLWPPMSNGTREIHVSLQVELFEDGLKVATLGPYHDWDVFNRYLPPPITCTQGCTPAYWVLHLNAFPVGLTASTSFQVAFGAGPNIPLSQALVAASGPDAKLQREASAALLNVYSRSSSFQYTFNAQTVIYLTRFAYLDGKFEVADTFAIENARGCPLR
jgi:hypothetical protein